MTDQTQTLTWRRALQDKKFVVGLSVSLLGILLLPFFMPYFFGDVILHKPGPMLNDIVLEHLPPTNWSWTIFTLIYSSTVLTLATNFKNPKVVLIGVATYMGITWIRMLSIYLFTLEPPQGIIALVDPFLALVVYPGEFSKDLFFSGHVSSMTVFVLMEPNVILRRVKLVATVVVGFLLMLQHVHYTLDILAAPILTWIVYVAVVKAQNASAMFK